MDYEWDPKKALANLRKHGVDFAEAVIVLEDELAITVPEEHEHEDRFVTIGMDATGRVLVVVYTMRGERTRIISARKATPSERRECEE